MFYSEVLDDYIKDGGEVPSSPPRSTDFTMEGTIAWGLTEQPKRLPKIKRKGPSGKKVAPLPINDECANVEQASYC